MFDRSTYFNFFGHYPIGTHEDGMGLMILLILSIVIIFCCPNSNKIFLNFEHKFYNNLTFSKYWNLFIFILGFSTFLTLLHLNTNINSEFIYYQF